MNRKDMSSAAAAAEAPRYPTPEHPLREVETIDATSISPAAFFDKYVKKRIPVKLIGCIADKCWNGKAWTDLKYLDDKCGQCDVKIERRADPLEFSNDFGNGLEKHMTFSEFLHAIQQGDESLYMTTQKLGYSAEGEPDIVSAPLTHLKGEYPWRPSLMGHLVTQNINMWIGRSAAGTCSGLHHDHHDNLYILLKGKKQFKLFSPGEIDSMYVRGNVTRVHPNGRINYANQSTRADGADVAAGRAMQASLKLEQLAAQADDDSDAEDQIDAALQDLLDAHMEGSDVSDCSEEESGSDADFSDEQDVDPASGLEGFLGVKRKVSDRNNSEDSSECVDARVSKATKIDDSYSSDKPFGTAAEDEAAVAPTNFSQIVTSLPEDILKERYPKFVEARTRQLEVELNEGEMLYLPCGWFHEVTSMSVGVASTAEGKGVSDSFHMAANYWFHPPDGSAFELPYADSFWSDSWKLRQLDEK